MTDLVVADASPLIALAKVGHLQTLALVAGRVIVPNVVIEECTCESHLPGAAEIGRALAMGWLHPQPTNPAFEPTLAPGIDAGEASAIGLAIALNAPILIDERIGRRIATAHSLKVIGTMGILLRAKQLSKINAVAPILIALREAGIFVAPALEQEVLRRADELLPG